MKTRIDTHRPSQINPEEYLYVAMEYAKEDLGMASFLLEERAAFKAHRKATGGNFSRHDHGGVCMICGSVNAIYTVLFYHQKTNSYIRTGQDCAAKLYMGDQVAFKRFRTACSALRAHKAGKLKAQGFLAEANLTRAWEISEMSFEEAQEAFCPNKTGLNSRPGFEYKTVKDIVNKLVKYGSISEKQISFLGKLIDQLANIKEKYAKQDAERAAAKDCPEGRIVIKGEVVKVDTQENDYGTREVMTVKHADGWLVWGTVPSSLGVNRGDEVEFTASVTASDNDSKFGFYKRPSKATNLTDSKV